MSEVPRADAAFRCKRCRFVLFYGRNVGAHEVGRHRFAPKKEAKVCVGCVYCIPAPSLPWGTLYPAGTMAAQSPAGKANEISVSVTVVVLKDAASGDRSRFVGLSVARFMPSTGPEIGHNALADM